MGFGVTGTPDLSGFVSWGWVDLVVDREFPEELEAKASAKAKYRGFSRFATLRVRVTT